MGRFSWFWIYVLPPLILAACIYAATLFVEDIQYDQRAAGQQGVPGVFVAEYTDCGRFGCDTSGEWRADVGGAVIADAWLGGQYEPGAAIRAQAFPDDDWLGVYPIDYRGDFWVYVPLAITTLGGLACIATMVMFWGSAIKSRAAGTDWKPVAFRVRASKSEVDSWASQKCIPGRLEQLQGGWVGFGTVQRRGGMIGPGLGPQVALAQLASLAHEPYLIENERVSVLRDGRAHRVRERGAALPWEQADQRVRRVVVAVPTPAEKLPRQLKKRVITVSDWVLLDNDDLDAVLPDARGRQSMAELAFNQADDAYPQVLPDVYGRKAMALMLTVLGDEVRLALHSDGCLDDEWTWNAPVELINPDRIPSTLSGEAARAMLDYRSLDVDTYDDLWPPHVDQDALAAVVGNRGSAAEIVDALIAVLHLPEETRRLLLG